MPMKVEQLLAERKKGGKTLVELPIPAKELCSRYEALYTGAINDVLREKMLLYQAFPGNILPLREKMKACGIAFTIKGTPEVRINPDDMPLRAKMLEELHEDSFVVWDTSGDTESSQWGEMITRTALGKGCRGALVDGGIRDTHQVLAQNFPVWVRYRTSNAMMGRFRITDWQIPIQIGKVFVYPGDVVFADIDGGLVIPRELAYEVLLRSEEIKQEEGEITKWVESGMSATEVVAKGGYF